MRMSHRQGVPSGRHRVRARRANVMATHHLSNTLAAASHAPWAPPPPMRLGCRLLSFLATACRAPWLSPPIHLGCRATERRGRHRLSSALVAHHLLCVVVVAACRVPSLIKPMRCWPERRGREEEKERERERRRLLGVKGGLVFAHLGRISRSTARVYQLVHIKTDA
jgi:hypothetical protein